MIHTLCPHCEISTNAEPAEVTYCQSCTKPFICINAYCASRTYQQCRCWNFIDNFAYLGKLQPILAAAPLPAYLIANKPLSCNECGHSWGQSVAVFNKFGEQASRPFDGHFAVKLEAHNLLQLYHGTSPDRLDSICANGLRPPGSPNEKRKGFNNEGKLRYTGRDRTPAENHSESNCIIELSYSGLTAITKLTCVGDELNLLFENMPSSIGGIEYIEDGRSIAFRPEAVLDITKIPHQEKKKEIGLMDRLKSYLPFLGDA